MGLVWNDKLQHYNADFAVTKQCRSFEPIHNWAKNREAKTADQLEKGHNGMRV